VSARSPRNKVRFWRSGRFAAIALGCSALALIEIAPHPTSAERARAPYRIGVLNDARAANHPTVEGLKIGLRGLGLEEGRDVIFDVWITDANPERMPAGASALVKAGVDLIVTSGVDATFAAKAATQSLPIVFTLVGDPVAAGLVKSLIHPGANLTGVSSLTTELVAKRLEALKALAPGLRRVWAISPGPAIAGGSSAGGLVVVSRTVRTPDELERTLNELRPGDGLLVPDSGTMDISAVLLEASLARRIPAVFSSELWVDHGGLVSYGADYQAQGLQAARLVAKILRGAHPENLPVESPGRMILAVNLKTAALLGVTAPREILFRADVIRR